MVLSAIEASEETRWQHSVRSWDSREMVSKTNTISSEWTSSGTGPL